MQCTGWACTYYCFLTFIFVMIITFFFHLLFYLWFSYYYVGNFHSTDLIKWKEDALEKIDDSMLSE